VDDETTPADSEDDPVGEGLAPPAVEDDTTLTESEEGPAVEDDTDTPAENEDEPTPTENETDPALIPRVDDVATLFEGQQITAEDLAAIEHLQNARALSEADLAALAGSATAAINDPGYANNGQWHLQRIGITNDTDAANHPWKVSTGKGVTVAVIDSGIARNHPDLKANISAALSTCSFAINGTADNNGHGTHVAGIIAAVANNGKGVASVAPGAKIVSIKALDYYWNDEEQAAEHGGTSADIARAVNTAVSRKVHVINMSLGGYYAAPDPVYQKAVENAVAKGIVVVAAAGNEGKTLSAGAAEKCYPAQFANVIAVSATTSGNAIAGYSNRGNGVITIAAPGSAILSTWLAGSYTSIDGTSMAAPVVSGVAALAIAANPTFKSTKSIHNVTAVTELLRATANGASPYNNTANFGAGLVNAAAAMAAMSAAVPAPEFAEANGATLPPATNAAGTVTINVSNHSSGTVYYYTQNGKTPTLATPDKSTNGAIVIQANGLKSASLQVVAARNGKLSPVTKRSFKLEVKISSFTLASSTGSNKIGIGKKLTLKPTFTPSKPSNTALDWASSNTVVATVDSKGAVTAKGPGSATITATAKDGSGKTATFAVTVNNPIDKVTAAVPATVQTVGGRYAMSYPACTYNEIPRAGSFTMSLAASDKDGAAVGVTAADFTFKSSNERIAYVDASGLVTAYSTGNATITATAKDGSGKKASINVNVVVPARIVLVAIKEGQIPGAVTSGTSSTVFTVAKGKSINMSATLGASFTTNKKLVWAAGNDRVTVSQSGKITGVEAGVSTVTVRGADGVNPAWTININVTPPGEALKLKTGALSKVTLTLNAAANLAPDNRTAAGSAYNFAGALDGSGAKVVYRSSNEKVAFVDNVSGLVTAVGTGTAKITARTTDGSGKSVSISVTVKRPATNYAGDQTTVALGAGKKMKLGLVLLPTNASSKKVRWQVSNTNAFSISGGTVTAKSGKAPAATAVSFQYVRGWTFDGQELWSSQVSGFFSDIASRKETLAGIAFDGRKSSASLGGSQNPFYAYDDTVGYQTSDFPITYLRSLWSSNNAADYGLMLRATSSNYAVADVAVGNNGTTGSFVRIWGESPGKATITVSTTDGSNKKIKINVTVSARPRTTTFN
ncbi:MAG: S8 family serine peptidase, partial [Lachnospiraceae bacterium]|nr:S8 family serine peptidase [Lachnospiraceae bacterium]